MSQQPAPDDGPVIEFLQGIASIFTGGAQDPSEIDPKLAELIAARPAPELRPGETAESAAKDRVARAWESEHGPELAVEAIRLWPECAEAYLYLASIIEGQPAISLALFTLAADAASDALGPDYVEQYGGAFWEREETRPLMRAIEGMGRCYWSVGALDLAADQFAEMLTLNPNDDQGVRYPLAACLLEMGNHEAVTQLLTMYDDGSAPRAYLVALAAFQEGGDVKARPALANAVGQNAVIAEYLGGERAFPQEALDLQIPPAVAEAMVFADMMSPAWSATEGAIDWLQRWSKPDAPRAGSPSKEKRSGPRSLD